MHTPLLFHVFPYCNGSSSHEPHDRGGSGGGIGCQGSHSQSRGKVGVGAIDPLANVLGPESEDMCHAQQSWRNRLHTAIHIDSPDHDNTCVYVKVYDH